MLLSLEPRGQQSRLMLWCSPLLAAALTLGCGALLFIALGHDPLLTLHTLLIAPVSDLYGVSELLVKALPILLCALGLAVAYQARIWNIGAEGQLLLGALAGSALAVNIIDMQSRWALVLILLVGTLAGAAWGGLTAWLRTRFNANEILTSIMLNYIALNLLLFCVHGPLKDPAGFNFPESAMFGDASRLPLLMEDGRVHAGVYFALLALVAVWVLLQKSFVGFQIKVLGLDKRAAGFVGFREKRLIWHLYEAALAGRDIYYDQRCAQGLEMRATLEAILSYAPVAPLGDRDAHGAHAPPVGPGGGSIAGHGQLVSAQPAVCHAVIGACGGGDSRDHRIGAVEHLETLHPLEQRRRRAEGSCAVVALHAHQRRLAARAGVDIQNADCAVAAVDRRRCGRRAVAGNHAAVGGGVGHPH